MKLVRTLVSVSLALGFVIEAAAASVPIEPGAAATAPPADASGDTRYVVLSRQSFDASRVLAREATAWVDTLGRDLVVAEVDTAQIGAIGRHIHEVENRCGGFFAFASRPEAEAFIAHDRTAQAIALPLGGLYTIDNQATVDAWLPQVAEANIRATIATLSAYRNRYYASPTGRQAAEWIRDSWQALIGSRTDASVALFEGCTDCSTQPSVILTVQGTELPKEVVVVGGHLDSINWSTGFPTANDIAPGADDDASGIATITEIARIALASGWKPKRTVKFMGYAAEEVGLNGSDAIAQRFRSDGINVIGVLQLDMTNYKNGAPYDLQIVSDNSNAALLTYFAELFDEYLAPLGFVRSPLACGYGCSDHASWTTAGYPAGMVFEAGQPRDPNNPRDLGDFPFIHSAGDTLANMNNSAEYSVKFAQFGLAFVGELAKTHDGGGVNQAPVAGFSYSADRMQVSFTDTSTDSDGSIASRRWDFGDGTTSDQTNPVRTYTTVGEYSVALTVTDNGGLPNNTIQTISVDNGIVPLINGVTTSGLPAQEDTRQLFTLELPPGAQDLHFALIADDGGQAYVSVALGGQVLCESAQAASVQNCAIGSRPAAGSYTATVHSVTALSGFILTASYVAPGDRIFADDFEL